MEVMLCVLSFLDLSAKEAGELLMSSGVQPDNEEPVVFQLTVTEDDTPSRYRY